MPAGIYYYPHEQSPELNEHLSVSNLPGVPSGNNEGSSGTSSGLTDGFQGEVLAAEFAMTTACMHKQLMMPVLLLTLCAPLRASPAMQAAEQAVANAAEALQKNVQA